ncbi:uncharacterized protein MONBRDRAFT_35657 [Monosiga brevicollis MX1]|uniref:F-box domain-containing protein n=1 Tax=Monosiga brevicollis TaxID=81824 RepID=A9UQK3_MONBE|nr:uncharacterized protein MONBRDRAFT_35657 [Monosiga brevicollis MX1]EDQ92613.1 predicted protein [Monosiga brevicollis MX1]|eukprot:XP_001742375.1 hypothetical protein [Monosiga brevicollis MX1]
MDTLQPRQGIRLRKCMDVRPVVLPDDVLLNIFSRFSPRELLVLMQVCRQWRRVGCHPHLWTYVNFGLAGCELELQVDDQGLGSCLRLGPVFQLDLELCRGVRQATLAVVATQCATTLQRLNLAGCRSISPSGLAPLVQCTQLRVLSLRGCVQCSDESIAGVLRACPKLAYLDLGFIPGLDKQVGQALGQLPHLRHLSLRATPTNGTFLTHLARANPPLQFLSLRKCPLVPMPALAALLRTEGPRTHMQRLDLRQMPYTAEALAHFATLLDTLQSLLYVDVDAMLVMERFVLTSAVGGYQYQAAALDDDPRDSLQNNTFYAAFAPGPTRLAGAHHETYGCILD